MSQQASPVLALTIAATGAITKRRFVTAAGALAAAAARALGVAKTDGVSGDQIAVDVLGTAIVETGAGAIAVGAQVEVDASARAVTKSAGVAVGHALQASSGAGEFIEVLLLPN